MTPICLISSTGRLSITLDTRGVGGWSQVELVVAGQSRPLGAERLKYIASRLVSFLADASPTSELRSVLGLSELHTRAYGERDEGGAVLHLQDSNGKMFAKLVLTPDEARQWLDVLSAHVEVRPDR